MRWYVFDLCAVGSPLLSVTKSSRNEFLPCILDNAISIYISAEGIDQQVSRITQVLSQTSAILADVVHLEIGADSDDLKSIRQDGIGEIAWAKFLHPFTVIKTLRVPKVLAGSVALENVTGEMGIQMLPCFA
jgi:hypothetical protein